MLLFSPAVSFIGGLREAEGVSVLESSLATRTELVCWLALAVTLFTHPAGLIHPLARAIVWAVPIATGVALWLRIDNAVTHGTAAWVDATIGERMLEHYERVICIGAFASLAAALPRQPRFSGSAPGEAGTPLLHP